MAVLGLTACSSPKPEASTCGLVATLQRHGSSASLEEGEITRTLRQVVERTRDQPRSELARAATEAQRTHDALVAESGLSRDFLSAYEKLLTACGLLEPT